MSVAAHRENLCSNLHETMAMLSRKIFKGNLLS